MSNVLKFQTQRERNIAEIIAQVYTLHKSGELKGLVVTYFTEEDGERRGVTDWCVEESGDVATAALMVQTDMLDAMRAEE